MARPEAWNFSWPNANCCLAAIRGASNQSNNGATTTDYGCELVVTTCMLMWIELEPPYERMAFDTPRTAIKEPYLHHAKRHAANNHK